MLRKSLLCVMAIAVSACAGPISFSGQFDPSLATVQTSGGNGWFDASGAPISVTLWGSDSWQDTQIITLVTWNITTPESNLWFRWLYETWDADGPSYDPAGYYLNGSYVQLTNDSGPNSQHGLVIIPSLSPGDVFGFYVDATDDCCGGAQISISAIPEPATWTLLALGGVAVLARRKLTSRARS
jgi:hypothetical protein